MTRERQDLKLVDDSLSHMKSIRHLMNVNVQVTLDLAMKKLEQYKASLNGQFGEWIRNNRRLSPTNANLVVSDLDWVIHQYKDCADKNGTRSIQNMMLVEEKRYGATMSDSQSDTLWKLDQVFSSGSHHRKQTPGWWVRDNRGNRIRLRYYGLHLLRFSGAGPVDSSEIFWDAHPQPITIYQLEQLLRFELHPRTLRDFDGTGRRHHANKWANELALWTQPKDPA